MPDTMTYRMGDGLPSTLTAERIKAVLGLVKSHECALKAVLDADASRARIETDSDGDLYQRLRALLATNKGRDAYEKARSTFEEAKSKRFGRANFLDRLVESCRQEVLGQSGAREYGDLSDRDLIGRLSEENAWTRLAELVWARSLMDGGAIAVLDAMAAYPEVRPYLEEVHAGLRQAEDDGEAPLPEEEGEAAAAADRIRRIAERLDASHLNEGDLLALSKAALHLVDIAKAQSIRDRDVSLHRAQVEDWETRHTEAIAGVVVTGALAALKARIDEGGMDREGVSAVLDLAEWWLSVDARYRETHKKLQQASSNADFESVRSLIDALESLDAERRKARAAIDRDLTKPRPDGTTAETPTGGGPRRTFRARTDRTRGQSGRARAAGRRTRARHGGPKERPPGAGHGARPSAQQRGERWPIRHGTGQSPTTPRRRAKCGSGG